METKKQITKAVKVTFKPQKVGAEIFERPPFYTTSHNIENIERIHGAYIEEIEDVELDEKGNEVNLKPKKANFQTFFKQAIDVIPMEIGDKELILGMKKKGKTVKHIARALDIDVNIVEKIYNGN
jgi:hypothetical protein